MAKVFPVGAEFAIDGVTWTVTDVEHTPSDGTHYVLEAPGADDIEIKSHAELEAIAT